MSQSRPEIKIRLLNVDYTLEILAVLAGLVMIVLSLFYYYKLPDVIPSHFNLSGKPDAYSQKWHIFILPFIGILLYTFLSILNKYPHKFNFPVIITNQNAEKQYSMACRMIRVLKMLVLMLFLYLTITTIAISMGKSEVLGYHFLPIFLILLFGYIFYYIRQSIKNK